MGGESRQVLGRMAACFLGIREKKNIYFRGVTIVAPPRAVWDYSDAEIYAMLTKGLEDIQGGPMSAATAGQLNQHGMQFMRLDSLRLRRVRVRVRVLTYGKVYPSEESGSPLN